MPKDNSKGTSKRAASSDKDHAKRSKPSATETEVRTQTTVQILDGLRKGTLSIFKTSEAQDVIRYNTRPAVTSKVIGWDAIAVAVAEESHLADTLPRKDGLIQIRTLDEWINDIPEHVLSATIPFLGEHFTWKRSSKTGADHVVIQENTITSLATTMIVHYSSQQSGESPADYNLLLTTWDRYRKINTEGAYTSLLQNKVIGTLCTLGVKIKEYTQETPDARCGTLTLINGDDFKPVMKYYHISSFVKYTIQTTDKQEKIMEKAKAGLTQQEIANAMSLSNVVTFMEGSKHYASFTVTIARNLESRMSAQNAASGRPEGASSKTMMLLPAQLVTEIQFIGSKHILPQVETWFGVNRETMSAQDYATISGQINKVLCVAKNMVLADICRKTDPSKESDTAKLEAEFTSQADGHEFKTLLPATAQETLSLRTIYDHIFDQTMTQFDKASLQLVKYKNVTVQRDDGPSNMPHHDVADFALELAKYCFLEETEYTKKLKVYKNSAAAKNYPEPEASILPFLTKITFENWDEHSEVFVGNDVETGMAHTTLVELFTRWKQFMRYSCNMFCRYMRHAPLHETDADTDRRWWIPLLDRLAQLVATVHPYMEPASKDVAFDMLYFLLASVKHPEVVSVKQFIQLTVKKTAYSILVENDDKYQPVVPLEDPPAEGSSSLAQYEKAGFDTSKLSIYLDDDKEASGISYLVRPNEFQIMQLIPEPLPQENPVLVPEEDAQEESETTAGGRAANKIQLTLANFEENCIVPFISRMSTMRPSQSAMKFVFSYEEVMQMAHILLCSADNAGIKMRFTITRNPDHYLSNGIRDICTQMVKKNFFTTDLPAKPKRNTNKNLDLVLTDMGNALLGYHDVFAHESNRQALSITTAAFQKASREIPEQPGSTAPGAASGIAEDPSTHHDPDMSPRGAQASHTLATMANADGRVPVGEDDDGEEGEKTMSESEDGN